MDDIWLAVGAGVAAGLGVAMPLGAIAALLVREGLVNGFRVAAAGATGVAVVDTAYCLVAAVAGTLLVPLLEAVRGPFLVLAGCLVIVVGMRQLASSRKGADPDAPDVAPARSSATFARFVALTAVNPLTLVYFVALAGAVTTRSDEWIVLAAFVLAVGLSSWGWQLLLAASGSFFGATLGSGAGRTVGTFASAVVIALGAVVVASGLRT